MYGCENYPLRAVKIRQLEVFDQWCHRPNINNKLSRWNPQQNDSTSVPDWRRADRMQLCNCTVLDT